MNKAELDKITERVLSLLRESGISISGSGSARAETGSHVDPGEAVERSPFKMDPMLIPVVITDRTAYLSKKDMEICFGTSSLHEDKRLSQRGRVVYEETVTVSGPDGSIGDVHVCASNENKSRVELLSGDNLILGINAPLRLSNDIECSPGLTVDGPSGSLKLEEGAIIPMRKITLDPEHAKHYGMGQGQMVSVEVSGSRGGTLANVAVITESGLDCFCYIDVNEAAAMCIAGNAMVKIVK